MEPTPLSTVERKRVAEERLSTRIGLIIGGGVVASIGTVFLVGGLTYSASTHTTGVCRPGRGCTFSDEGRQVALDVAAGGAGGVGVGFGLVVIGIALPMPPPAAPGQPRVGLALGSIRPVLGLGPGSARLSVAF